jgi:hypothetical protein
VLHQQLGQAAHRLIVTARDHDADHPDAEDIGLPVDANDPDNVGALLARPVAGLPRNTLITPRVMKRLHAEGINRIVVRSPITGGPPQGGVYARDVGVRERGGLSPVGDYVGHAAAQSLCLAAGTLVRMADGSAKAIEDIRAGDMVIGSDTAGYLRPTSVVRVYDNGEKDCYKTVFRRGTGKSQPDCLPEIVSTLEHKILAVCVSKSAKKPEDRRPPRPMVDVRARTAEIRELIAEAKAAKAAKEAERAKKVTK